MEHLFYFLGILILMYELYWIATLQRRYETVIAFKMFLSQMKAARPNSKPEWDEYPDYLKRNLLVSTCAGIFMAVWLFAGLLTSQWITFLALLILQLGVFGLINKVVGTSPLRYASMLCSGISFFTGVLFIILNKYHLHIDMYQWFLDNVWK